MILKNHTPITRIGEFKEFFYKVNPENLGALFHLLRNQLYSDKLSAILREYGTNAADAHTETDQTRPFEVHLPTEINPNLRIRDFGPGLALDELESIYTSMGETTKNQSNLLNGCQGIGCKSAFSYSPTFEVVSRHENTIIHALAYIDETRRGKMTILETGKLEADEPQGLEIIVPILKDDFGNVAQKAKKIFAAFAQPPLVFKGTDIIDIKSKLRGVPVRLEEKDWSANHKCLVYSGNVAYPVDTEAAGLPDPGEIRSRQLVFELPIGSVHFTASRETLEYTETTKKSLQAALAEHVKTCQKDAKKVFSRLRLGQKQNPETETPANPANPAHSLWAAHILSHRLLAKVRNTENQKRKPHPGKDAIYQLQALGGLEFEGMPLPAVPWLDYACLIWRKATGEWEHTKSLTNYLKIAARAQKQNPASPTPHTPHTPHTPKIPWGKTKVFVAYDPTMQRIKNKVPLGKSRRVIRWEPRGKSGRAPDAWAKRAKEIADSENLDTAIFPLAVQLPLIPDEQTRKNPALRDAAIKKFIHKRGLAPKDAVIPLALEYLEKQEKSAPKQAKPRKPAVPKTRVCIYACSHVGKNNEIVSPKHGELLLKDKGENKPVTLTGLFYPQGKPEAWWAKLEYADGTTPVLAWTGQTTEHQNPLETGNVLTRAKMMQTFLPELAWEKTLIVTVSPPEMVPDSQRKKMLKEWKARDISKEIQKEFLKMSEGHCQSHLLLTKLTKALGPKTLAEIPALRSFRKGPLPFQPKTIATILGKPEDKRQEQENKALKKLLRRKPMLELVRIEDFSSYPTRLKFLVDYLKKG